MSAELASLKLRLSRVCIQGELSLALVSVAVAYLYYQSISLGLMRLVTVTVVGNDEAQSLCSVG